MSIHPIISTTTPYMVQDKKLVLLSQYVILLLIACTAAFSADEKQKQNICSQPDKVLSALFNYTNGWAGADAAYSIPLNKMQTLWLFGDTFIGEIKDNKRVNTTMINNTVGVQNIGASQDRINFYWNKEKDKPLSIFQSANKEAWFWPGDGACLNKRLYLFLHQIKRKPGDDSAWGFIEDRDSLACVSNPEAPPTEWKYTQSLMPEGVHWGNAVLPDGDWLYVYCSYPKAAKGFFKHPLILARIQKNQLSGSSKKEWQYWCKNPNSSAGIWKNSAENPLIIFQDGAPELSVCRVPGKTGFYAVYFPGGLGPNIVLRHADRPEGPFGDAQAIYQCPEDKKIFVYSAKAHPELARKDGELPITYCRNTESLKDNFDNADIYVPRGVRLNLE